MYTEIKEVVNFIIPCLFSKVPRRKVITFAEQLANILVCRFKDVWHSSEDDLRHRIHMRVVVQTERGPKVLTDPDILSAAKSVALDVDEVVRNLPEGTILYVNPGEVFVSVAGRDKRDNRTSRVWTGSPEADREYSPIPEAFLHRDVDSLHSDSFAKEVHPPENYVSLKLDLSSDKDILRSEVSFTAQTPEATEFAVEQFSVTRFGSHRARPDHEVMKRIQRQAAFEAMQKIGGMRESSSIEDSLLSSDISLLSTGSPHRPSLPPVSNTLDILKTMSSDQRRAVASLLSDARLGHNLDNVMSALGDMSVASLHSSMHFNHHPIAHSLVPHY